MGRPLHVRALSRSFVVALALAGGCQEPLVVGGVDVGPPPVPAEEQPGVAPSLGARQDAPEAAAQPPAPRQVPYDAEAEARAREAQERAAFEAEWPLHGISYHFLAQVRARADGSSPVVGYLRRGSTFRAKPGLRGPGCRRGWHEIPGGGYVCRGEGFLLGERAQSFEPSPSPAALTDALPYPYAYVGREDAPLYWRLPSVAEEASAARLVEQLRDAAAAAEARAAVPVPAPRGEPSEAAATEGDGAEPDLEAPPGLVASDEAEAAAALVLPDFMRMRMRRGFYISVDGEEVVGDRRFFRTVRGNYVPAEVMVEAHPPEMRGVVLGGLWRPPLAFVFRRGVTALVRDAVSGVLSQAEHVDYHLPLLLEQDAIIRRGSRYRVSREGIIVRESALRLVGAIERPPGVQDDERWIHVDLSEQTLVAYEGDRPVFTTLVSTGRAGFASPIGTFRIMSKHVSATMDDPDSLTDAYSIEDVPWTMYFEGSYALHGAFWHDSFGHVRSHGCVNLAPADARWLFQFAEPALPPGWHGVFATSRRPGTIVHITE